MGRLLRIHRGVYAVGHEELTWEGRCLAAVLAALPAVASHFSAGWLWGVIRNRPGTIHVTVPTPRRARRPFLVHFADLPARDRSEVDGIPVTSLPRTLLDLATTMSPTQLERTLERAEEQRRFDLPAFEEILERAGHHPGTAKLRRALAIYRYDPTVKRSDLERHFLALVSRAGLPRPAANFNVAGYELDAYWERERFAVELDVYATHGSQAAFERDRRRREDLKLKGVETIDITGPRLEAEPKRTIERVAAHLAQRRRDLGR